MSRRSVMWNQSSRRSVGVGRAMVAEIFEQEVTQIVGPRGLGGSSLVSRRLPTTRQGGLETTPRLLRITGQLPDPTHFC
jgi:ABC-type enterochelin transport system ATPase subunit